MVSRSKLFSLALLIPLLALAADKPAKEKNPKASKPPKPGQEAPADAAAGSDGADEKPAAKKGKPGKDEPADEATADDKKNPSKRPSKKDKPVEEPAVEEPGDAPPKNTSKRLPKKDKKEPAQPEETVEKPVKDPAGFVRLFNNRSMNGWYGDKSGWSVADGSMHFDPSAITGGGNGIIHSQNTHGKSLIFRAEYRLGEGAEPAVVIHGQKFPLVKKEYEEAAKPAGEWNTLEIDVSDGLAEIKINGKSVEQGAAIGKTANKGIGLVGGPGPVDFRKVVLKEK